MSRKLNKQLERLDRSHQGRQNTKTVPFKLSPVPPKLAEPTGPRPIKASQI